MAVTRKTQPRDARLLPTAVVGSYAVPEWLERVKTDYFQRRISSETLEEIHDVAIKAALKDQELAGIDVITDGELRRDNMVDHFAVRLAGIEIDRQDRKPTTTISTRRSCATRCRSPRCGWPTSSASRGAGPTAR